MCVGNIIIEYRVVLENFEISQFAQLLQKARKAAQLVKPSSNKPKKRRSTLQAMTVSTGKKKRKPKGGSTRTLRQFHAHQRSWMWS